jgi:sugar phosphate isomerase/epimerase
MTGFSYQLYSSRNFPPLADTFKMLAETGYTATEGYGGLYADAAGLSSTERGIKDAGLTMPTGHFSLEMCRDTPKWSLEVAKRLGMVGVIVPYIMPDARPGDAAGWSKFGSDLAETGKAFADAGLFFGYHNHDFEYVATDGGHLPIDLILNAGESLSYEFDVAWSVRGGTDPMDTIHRHGRRIRAAHVKDIAPASQNADEDGWADVGHGTVPWARLLPALRAVGCGHFVMEHDNPSDHRRFASRSLAAAKSM